MKTLARQGVLLPPTRTERERGGSTSSTFVRNVSLPIHGWFRFPAGFSAEWVRDLIEEEKQTGKLVTLLDPFAGVGTAVLAGEEAGVPALGLEAQPFIARVAKAKLLWHTDAAKFSAFASAVLEDAKGRNDAPLEFPPLIRKCYPDDVLRDLQNLRCAWENAADGGPPSELTWLALTSILRVCSPVGTAPWQYVLPAKSKEKTVPPYRAFAIRVQNMVSDMTFRQSQGVSSTGEVLWSDARECGGVGDDSITLVVTSPPYTNNYDYADATRLEMSFFGEVRGWGDLHQKARRWLIRACSQHASIERLRLRDILESVGSVSFLGELQEVCAQLAAERLRHGGKKDYHLMVAAYFADMRQVWGSLRRVCKPGATLCFVVGDSAPYGVYVPVDRWLGELAVAAGFHSYRFERLRDRNVKWKNRKHRVPLHEGRLWVEG